MFWKRRRKQFCEGRTPLTDADFCARLNVAPDKRRFVAAAREARRFEYADLAQKLIIHARIEEEVMYPAAIVAGEYVRLKLGVAEPA